MCPLPQRKGNQSSHAEPPAKSQTTLDHKTGSVPEKAETSLDQESWVKTLMHLSGTSWSFSSCQPPHSTLSMILIPQNLTFWSILHTLPRQHSL